MSQNVEEQILEELQSLRREVAFLLPTESLSDYENEEGISDALVQARAELAG